MLTSIVDHDARNLRESRRKESNGDILKVGRARTMSKRQVQNQGCPFGAAALRRHVSCNFRSTLVWKLGQLKVEKLMSPC